MTSRNASARKAAESALVAANVAMRERDFPRAHHQLTQAHVLGQPFSILHVRVHWAMLRYGWSRHDVREVKGQLIRLLVAGPSSLLGVTPPGNIGWSSVSMFQRMDNKQKPNAEEKTP